MRMPVITADLSKLRRNLSCLAALCRRNGISFAAVTKCVCADSRIAAIFAESADMLADSRLLNLQRLPSGKPHMLLRIADPHEADEAVASADISLHSEIDTIERFGRAAARANRKHRVLLMIDLGDLREGILYSEQKMILQAAGAVCAQPSLKLAGIGSNLTCFGGILPDEQNLGKLVSIAATIRKALDTPLPLVSGGNSSTLPLLLEKRLPRGINHLRLGESLLLGRETAFGRPLPGMHGDAFTLTATLVEIQKKPSLPIGTTGVNAFGETVSFIDEGDKMRGILAVGRQDTDTDGLCPQDDSIRILGASSDHLIVDLSRARTAYRVGDELSFWPNYGALLRAYTSPYVEKAYC